MIEQPRPRFMYSTYQKQKNPAYFLTSFTAGMEVLSIVTDGSRSGNASNPIERIILAVAVGRCSIDLSRYKGKPRLTNIRESAYFLAGSRIDLLCLNLTHSTRDL